MKEVIEYHEAYYCMTCGETGQRTKVSMVEHLREEHKIEEVKGTKTLVVALDFSDSYSNTYEWEVQDGVKFTELCSGPRVAPLGEWPEQKLERP